MRLVLLLALLAPPSAQAGFRDFVRRCASYMRAPGPTPIPLQPELAGALAREHWLFEREEEELFFLDEPLKEFLDIHISPPDRLRITAPVFRIRSSFSDMQVPDDLKIYLAVDDIAARGAVTVTWHNSSKPFDFQRGFISREHLQTFLDRFLNRLYAEGYPRVVKFRIFDFTTNIRLIMRKRVAIEVVGVKSGRVRRAIEQRLLLALALHMQES
ncbi:MAG: hypothetical protein KF799_09300 [Bdellovibrionales bacterium]|nr:hypothetical protein [Bdellovibrionales bacterium]